MSRCRSCNAEIEWAITGGEKRMPVQYDEGGDLVVWTEKAILRCRVLAHTGDTIMADERLAVSHFALCPRADQHRRPRGKAS